jgi:hypothetical protein
MDDPAVFSFSNCPRILLALTKDWRAEDNSRETLACARTALAKLIYALKGQGFPDPAPDSLVQQSPETWKDCLAASGAARDERERPLPPGGRYAVLWFRDKNGASKLAPSSLNWPRQANMTFGPIVDADNKPKLLFFFEEADEGAMVSAGVCPSPDFWPKRPARRAPVPLLVRILIGSPGGGCRGGIVEFLQYALHYASLAYRLVIAAAIWLGFSALSWVGFKWWALSLTANLGFVAIEIYASLIGVRFVADRAREEFGRILAARWLPILVIVVAAYLLLANDQGSELGVGVMDGNFKALVKALCLWPVLVYWALNNWLSARIGLSRTFPEPKRGRCCSSGGRESSASSHTFWQP